MVFPGDTLEISASITNESARGITGDCEIKVGDQVVTTIEGLEVGLIPNMKMARMLIGREKRSRKSQ